MESLRALGKTWIDIRVGRAFSIIFGENPFMKTDTVHFEIGNPRVLLPVAINFRMPSTLTTPTVLALRSSLFHRLDSAIATVERDSSEFRHHRYARVRSIAS